MSKTHLRRVRLVVEAKGVASPADWADALSIALPPNAARALARFVERDGSLRLSPDLPTLSPDDAKELRLRAAFTERAPASNRLPFSYQRVPLPLRTAIGHVIGRAQRLRSARWAAFPQWPIDLSADVVSDLAGEPSPLARCPVPVLLTHDLDTPEGLRNAVDMFLPIEDASGARAAHYIVPCAWPLDHGLIRELIAHGHEIGVHGFDHSNRTPYAGAPERDARLQAARDALAPYGPAGYRAPSLTRTRTLLDGIGVQFAYDTSIPTSGGLFPVPNNGCASGRPFRIGNLTEIPLTLPRDGSLRFLGHKPETILRIWQDCAEMIVRSRGLISLLTHCEKRSSGNSAMLSVYGRFVSWLASDPRFEFTTPLALLERVTVT